jgi:hypothetical protein
MDRNSCKIETITKPIDSNLYLYLAFIINIVLILIINGIEMTFFGPNTINDK